MMRPPNLSLLSEAPKTATERGCRMRSSSMRGRARSRTAAACRGISSGTIPPLPLDGRPYASCDRRRGITMTFRIIRLALGATALALTATLPVVAQSVETRGVVQRVDVPSSTVYFTDGRIARIAPGSRLTVDDRPITLADVQPGWTLVIPAAVVATA